MGQYINPGNGSFRSDLYAEIYVDKSGLLEILNRSVDTPQRCYAVSRPRRFGKSMAAGMLDAYYSCGCDSHELFDRLKIAGCRDYEAHLNRYNVLHFDVSTFFYRAEDVRSTVDLLNAALLKDCREEFPEAIGDDVDNASVAVQRIYRYTGVQFVIIIDEWDCIIRDAKHQEGLIRTYLRYLRGFFKTEESKQFLALGYITGILPIKKIDGESAMNNFEEFTMISPGMLAPYFGFTEEEVDGLCERYHTDVEQIRNLYDGYRMRYSHRDCDMRLRTEHLHIYNPNSLVLALRRGEMDYYWKNTGAFRMLNTYIERNEAGLKDAVVHLLAGEEQPVNVGTFQNDLTSFKKKDDVLTALIHMGYLGYNPETKCAFIPNEEVRAVFESAIEVGGWSDIRAALTQADELLDATWRGDEKRVASMIDESQQKFSAIISYHNENALACAIMMSYYTARAHYTIRRELPAGRGFADIAFIPKRDSAKPAMIVELKWEHSADAAVRQIHERNYTGALADYKGDILLVGINYSKTKGEHSCRIEHLVF